MNVTPKRWLQFNLAALFLLTTLVAIGLIWPGLWRAAAFGLAALCGVIAVARLLTGKRRPRV